MAVASPIVIDLTQDGDDENTGIDNCLFFIQNKIMFI
jgi:hypothetical protein